MKVATTGADLEVPQALAVSLEESFKTGDANLRRYFEIETVEF